MDGASAAGRVEVAGAIDGAIDNAFPAARFPQQTHFAFLEEHGFDWRIYYSDDTWMVPPLM